MIYIVFSTIRETVFYKFIFEISCSMAQNLITDKCNIAFMICSVYRQNNNLVRLHIDVIQTEQYRFLKFSDLLKTDPSISFLPTDNPHR